MECTPKVRHEIKGPATLNGGEACWCVGYMSPGQVRGQAADRSSDIFALGAVLHEMLTGKRAFHKPTSLSVVIRVSQDAWA